MSTHHFCVDGLDTTNYGKILSSFLAMYFRLEFFSRVDQYNKGSEAL